MNRPDCDADPLARKGSSHLSKKYDEEFRTRAVRLVTGHRGEYDTRAGCL